jgi:hypothetical protein
MTEKERVLALTEAELNVEVHTKVMELEPIWRKIPCPDGLPGCEVLHGEYEVPNYCNDHNLFHTVVQRLDRTGLLNTYAFILVGMVDHEWSGFGEFGEAVTNCVRSSLTSRCRAAILTVLAKQA